MKIDLDWPVGVPEGAETLESDDTVGVFSDDELVDVPEGDDGEEEEIAIDNIVDATNHNDLVAFDAICLCAGGAVGPGRISTPFQNAPEGEASHVVAQAVQ